MTPEEIQAKYGYTEDQALKLAQQSGWVPEPVQDDLEPVTKYQGGGAEFIKPQPAQAPPKEIRMPEQVISAPRAPRNLDEGLSALAAVNKSQPPSDYQQTAQSPVEQATGEGATPVRQPTSFERDPEFIGGATPAKKSAAAGGGAAPGLTREKALEMARDASGLSNVSNETGSLRDNAEYRYRQAVDEQARAHANAYAETAGAMTGIADASKRLNEQLSGQAIAQKKAEDDYRTYLQSQVDDMKKYREDPDAGFLVQGTAGKLLRGVALALGAFGGSLNGTGKNAAAEVINSTIANEVAKQREMYARNKDRIAGLQGVYAQLRARGIDDRTAMLTAHQHYLDEQMQRIQANQAKLGSQDAKANGDKALADLDAKRADIDEQRQEAIGSMAWRLMHPGAAAGPKPFTEQQVGEYSSRLEKAGIPDAETEISDLKQHAFPAGVRVDSDQPIEGTGPWENIKDKVPVVGQYLHSKEGRINRGNIESLFLAYRHAITGAGGGDREMQEIKQAFEGAGTAAELNHAIKKADAILAAKKRNIQAGTKPEAVQEYDRRKQAITPPTVQLNKIREE